MEKKNNIYDEIIQDLLSKQYNNEKASVDEMPNTVDLLEGIETGATPLITKNVVGGVLGDKNANRYEEGTLNAKDVSEDIRKGIKTEVLARRKEFKSFCNELASLNKKDLASLVESLDFVVTTGDVSKEMLTKVVGQSMGEQIATMVERTLGKMIEDIPEEGAEIALLAMLYAKGYKGTENQKDVSGNATLQNSDEHTM